MEALQRDPDSAFGYKVSTDHKGLHRRDPVQPRYFYYQEV